LTPEPFFLRREIASLLGIKQPEGSHLMNGHFSRFTTDKLLAFLCPRGGHSRNARWRQRQLLKLPAEQHAQWIEDQDAEDARSQAYLRAFGVLLGGLGLSMALRETAYATGRYCR
jgi:hypothetical protein